MRLEGFIGAAYQLDSVNVANQRCVNLYPEAIAGGQGKAMQPAYLRATPGLAPFLAVGDGPLRCLHVDSIGRIFVVSGPELYLIVNRADWALRFNPTAYTAFAIDQTTQVDVASDHVFRVGHGYYTGLKVRVSSSGTIPTGLSVLTDYWVYVLDADKIKFATSLTNALAGVVIDITATGTGNLTVTPQIPATPAASPIANINITTDQITSTAHGLFTGLKVRLGMNGAIPTGLSLATDYFVIASSVDAIKLASSLANAVAGTAVDVTAISTAEWDISLVGANGQGGGNPAPLSTSTGLVKAASMSFGGEGTDSSTIFVDGVNNYLFKDLNGVTSFGILGSVTAAQVVFATTNNITIYTTNNAAALNMGGSFSIYGTRNGTAGTTITLDLYTAPSNPNAFLCRFTLQASATFTTADFVSYITNGYVTGKTINFNTFIGFSITDYVAVTFSQFVASGGGSQNFDAAFGPSPGTLALFAAITLAGADYGSVPTATDIAWSDGYFIMIEGGTNRFRVSDLQSFNVDALSFASAEGSPDIALACNVLNRYLYIFNEETIEVYANVGNPDFPFERLQGGFIEIGCAAAGSVAKVANSLCWLGRSESGQGEVYAIDGLTPRRISTHAIEQAIAGYADPSVATAYSYQAAGHFFYVLNFAEATWVCDLTTGAWHERAYTNAGNLERHRAQHCVYVKDQRIHVVADYATNQLFSMSESVYSDNGNAITRLRTTPHISNGRNRVFCSSFWLDMEVGIGLDGGVQGSSPMVILDWSNDGGHTWSSESWALADAGSGAIGDYSKRVIWNRLGSFRQRVFRVKITDPVKVRLIDAQIELEAGQS